MMLKFYSLILLLIVSPFVERVLLAQSNFPVSCSPYLLPQYSLNWSALTSSNNFLRVTLVLKDEKYQSGIVPVFLRFRFEQAGSVISTRPDYIPAIPINLSFGTPLTLYGSDLVNYFQAGNLIAQGAVDESMLRQGGRLPDGLWTLSVTAYEFDASRGHRQISETGIAMMQVFYGYPPQITYPAEGQVLQEQEVQNLLFSWMPRGTASRGGISGLIYTVELYEVSDGEIPNAVVQGKRPIFSTTTNTSNYLYGITDPALIVGRKYALRVRVQDLEGINEYQNDGYSEVVSFNYGRPCTSPENLSLASSLSRVYNLSWAPQVGAQTYEVAYKLTTASVWTTAIAYTGTFSVVKPAEGKYEFKVRSNCSLARQSEWSEIYSEPASVAVKSNSKPATSASNTSPPQTNSSNNSSNNSTTGNVEDPLDIIVSSQDISPAAIAQKRDELDKLETPSESRCGGSMHSTVDCNITPKVYSGTVAFVPAKGQKIYMNGYEIIVTSGDASAGEGLLYYPFVRQRIPVSWSGISIVEGEKGKDYGCITEGEVKAQGSNGTVVTNDLERQITALLSSGPGSYSGKFGEALEAMKAKAQELLDK
ncbi:hypothetical protein ACFFJX_21515 [Pseudarcicella hirudinis]|uniref:hypothetical protein n=3 Tax=Pseudarcicella hirudinis TaxID=1079859 RepID=UPI0035EFD0FF